MSRPGLGSAASPAGSVATGDTLADATGPAPTSMTATATLGSAASNATNQASVFDGSDAASAVGTSSAVPVLPAIEAPGSAAATPVPLRTTSSIMSRTWPATFG